MNRAILGEELEVKGGEKGVWEVVILSQPELESGWLARVNGLDAEYGYKRLFIGESKVSTPPGESSSQVYKHYVEVGEGIYQCDAPALREEAQFFVVEATQLRLLHEEEAKAMLRAKSSATLRDVEGACEHRRWAEALSAALNIEDDQVRHDALVLVTRARQERGDNGWVVFDGSPKQVRWASAIRIGAASRLAEYRQQWLEEYEQGRVEGMSQEVLDAMTRIAKASGRIREERDLNYWISYRHELESPEIERMLWALVKGAVGE